MTMRTSLSRHIPRTPDDREHLDAMARAAWHQQEAAMFRRDQVRSEMEWLFIEAMANKLYGERRGG